MLGVWTSFQTEPTGGLILKAWRSATDPFRQGTRFLPDHLAPEEESEIRHGDDDPVRHRQQVAVLEPRRVLVDEGAAAAAILRIRGVVRRETLAILAERAVAVIVLSPVDGRVVRISYVQPERA
jgi:hypothetical protein